MFNKSCFSFRLTIFANKTNTISLWDIFYIRKSYRKLTFSIGTETSRLSWNKRWSCMCSKSLYLSNLLQMLIGPNEMLNYTKHQDDTLDVSCLMLATMNLDLQKQHENVEAINMIKCLKILVQAQAKQEMFEVSRTFFHCRLTKKSPIKPHVKQFFFYYAWT